jgi:hypothetical protein
VGILMGVKDDTLEIEDYKIGEFYVSMVLRNRSSDGRWLLSMDRHSMTSQGTSLLSCPGNVYMLLYL